MLVHGDNLKQKENHKTKYLDDDSRRFLVEIREKYDEWYQANMALVGPGSETTHADSGVITQRVALFTGYKDFLDQQHYAEKFDSRSNLHSSVIEEFMYFLFKDLVAEFGEHALVGKSHTFKDIFFTPPNYVEMLRRPYGRIEKKDHDFIIGATIQASFTSSTPPDNDPDRGEEQVIVAEEPVDHYDVTVVDNTETHLFDIPAITIECKTYLDKTMLEGSSRAADDLKARNPNGLYIVVMEWIKLTDAINLRKYKVDQIYVLRKQRNTDREFRYADDYQKNPVSVEVVTHLFNYVREHLVADWAGGVENGVDRGWLI